MSKTPVSARSAADILAYVPHALGFAPRESFVFLTLHGNQLGATLRIDTPQAVEPDKFARMVLGYLSSDTDADGVLFIAYTDQPTIGGTKPYSAHAQALDNVLDAAGMPIKDSWLVSSKSWVTYFCEDEDCCAPHPVEEISDSAVSAQLVFEGSNPERETIADPDFTGNTANRERIAEILAGWTITDPTDWTAPVMAENRALWQETIGTKPTKDTALQLVAALHTPAIRDRVMVDTISTNDDLGTFAEVVIGRYTGRPDWERVDATQELVIELFRFTPPEARTPLFALLGWLNWYKGRSSIAAAYLTKARDADPGNRLAQLLTQLVDTGILPECVKHQTTAYQR
jgi:hypothetical protein